MAFEIESVAKELRKFCSTYPSLPLISVGSGFGYLERETKKLIPGREMILIDPAPDSYKSPLPLGVKQDQDQVRACFGLSPNYPLLKDLFVDRPGLFVGNASLLLLNWSDYGDEPYDLGAILLLRPRAIFLITHKGECANSKQLHRYFREEGKERYICEKRFTVKPLIGKEEDVCYCKENHSQYAMEWLVDSSFVPCQNKTTLFKEITCKSTEHKDSPALELVKSLMNFAMMLAHLQSDDDDK